MNLIRPSGGDATVLGERSTSLGGDAFQRIGYVSENQELPGWMTIRRFLRHQSTFYPRWDDAALIRRFKLPLDRKLKHLSRGQRMKAALTSILAFSPELIVLDEPLSGLDPQVRDELIEALTETTRPSAINPAGATILLSSHDLAEVEAFCTHVAFLHGGRLLFFTTMHRLFSSFRAVTVSIPTLSENSSFSTTATTSTTTNLSSRPEPADIADTVERPASEAVPPRGAPSSTTAPSSFRVGLGEADPSAASEPTTTTAAAPEAPAATWPASWLQPHIRGTTVYYTHSQAHTEPVEAQARRYFPRAATIEAKPMTLRAIFLAIVKAQDQAGAANGGRQ